MDSAVQPPKEKPTAMIRSGSILSANSGSDSTVSSTSDKSATLVQWSSPASMSRSPQVELGWFTAMTIAPRSTSPVASQAMATRLETEMLDSQQALDGSSFPEFRKTPWHQHDC